MLSSVGRRRGASKSKEGVISRASLSVLFPGWIVYCHGYKVITDSSCFVETECCGLYRSLADKTLGNIFHKTSLLLYQCRITIYIL